MLPGTCGASEQQTRFPCTAITGMVWRSQDGMTDGMVGALSVGFSPTPRTMSNQARAILKLQYGGARSEHGQKPQSTSHDHVCHLGPSGAPILLHVGLVCLGQTSRRLPCLSMIIGSFFGIPTNILQCKFWFTCQRSIAPPLRAFGKSSATCSRRRSQKELLRPVVGLVWCVSSGTVVSRSGSGACSAVTFARRSRRASESACFITCDGAGAGADHRAAADLG